MTTCTPRPVKRIEDRGQRRDEGLALAGLHLGDLALVQDHAADQLHVEMPLAQRALAGLAHRREHRRQQILHRLVLAFAILDRGQRRLPFGDFRAQLVVGELLELRLQPLISSTYGRSRLTSRSFFEPKIFRPISKKKLMPFFSERCGGAGRRCILPDPHSSKSSGSEQSRIIAQF